MTRTKLFARLAPIALTAIALIMARPAASFTPQVNVSNTGIAFVNHWNLATIHYTINPTLAPDMVGTQAQAKTAIQNAFNTWTAAPNTALSVAEDADSAIIDPNAVPAGTNLICFVCTNGLNFNNTDGTLAVTITTSDASGVISQANMFFNPNLTGSLAAPGACFTVGITSNFCPNGFDFTQDLQTVAVHEAGHFFGLDHSAVARAIMFPFAPQILQTLSWDDVAGISFLYPKNIPDVPIGTISGTVRLSSNGVFAAHVFANSTTNSDLYTTFGFANLRKSPVGTLSLPDGTYTLQGLPVDTYQVIAEPLDGPVTANNVDWGLNFRLAVPTNFTTRWH